MGRLSHAPRACYERRLYLHMCVFVFTPERPSIDSDDRKGTRVTTKPTTTSAISTSARRRHNCSENITQTTSCTCDTRVGARILEAPRTGSSKSKLIKIFVVMLYRKIPYCPVPYHTTVELGKGFFESCRGHSQLAFLVRAGRKPCPFLQEFNQRVLGRKLHSRNKNLLVLVLTILPQALVLPTRGGLHHHRC